MGKLMVYREYVSALEEVPRVRENQPSHQAYANLAYFHYLRSSPGGEQMKKHWLNLCLIGFLIAGLNVQYAQAEAGTVHTYVPIGSGYSSDTLQLFARQAVQHDTDGTV